MYDPSRPDFAATITLIAVGGRERPVMSGYRPNHRFGDRQELNSALHTYETDDWVQPGETVKATVSLLSAERLSGELYSGMTFAVQEGPKIVGSGVITKILNPIVARSPSPAPESGG